MARRMLVQGAMRFLQMLLAASVLAVTEPRRVTLAQALELAEQHQPELLAVRARVAASKMDAQVPRALWLPRFGATAQVVEGTANNSTASSFTGAGVDLPRIGATASGTASWRPEPSTLVGVGLRQEVFDFGRIAALSALADASAEVETHRAEDEHLGIRLAVQEGYYAVRTARNVLRAAEEAYQRASSHRDFALAGVKNGLRSPIEVTRAEADLMRFDVGRIRARGGLSVAQSGFAAAVGVNEWSLDASEEAPPRPETFADLAPSAGENAPRVLEAKARREAQLARTRIITAGLLPNLELSATLSGRAGGSDPTSGAVPVGGGWLPDVPNWDTGLVLSWTFLDFGVLAQRSASREQEQARVAEVDAARQTVRAAVQQSYEAVKVARETLPALQRAAEAARANATQTDARFKGGLGTSVELADAEGLRAEAEIQLALGEFEVVRAQSRLARLTGEGT